MAEDKLMITAVVYYDDRVIEVTSYKGGVVPETCIHTGRQETHYWVTPINQAPLLGTLCRCGEKQFHGLDEE